MSQFTDQSVMTQIQYAVIESPDGGQTWASGLWSEDEVVSYLNQRQNQFLKDTSLQFGIATINATAGVSIYDLPNDWINTVRVLWIDEEGVSVELGRSDTWEADYGMPGWNETDGIPKIFYDGGAPTTLEIMPAPTTDGTLQIHYTPYAALLTGDGELFTVPAEFVTGIKYGALEDMLSKVGRANDPPRAQYCRSRFQLGIEVARLLVGGFD